MRHAFVSGRSYRVPAFAGTTLQTITLHRVLMAYRARARSVFVFGFAKSARANIDEDELATLRDIAKAWLAADAEALARAVEQGLIQEVTYGEEET